MRALSHTAGAGTRVRRKVSRQRRATEDTHFSRHLQLLCLQQTGDGAEGGQKQRGELTGSCNKTQAKMMVVRTKDQPERGDLVKSKTHSHNQSQPSLHRSWTWSLQESSQRQHQRFRPGESELAGRRKSVWDLFSKEVHGHPDRSPTGG